MKKNIYFIRHGQRIDTVDENWTSQRNWDPPLSNYGGKQAYHLGRWLKDNVEIDCIYTSPFLRCLLTTKYILKGLHKNGKNKPCVFVEKGLCEFLTERWFSTNPDFLNPQDFFEPAQHEDIINPKFPERPKDMFNRYTNIFGKICGNTKKSPKGNEYENILIVSHGYFVTTICQALDKNIGTFFVPECSLNHVIYDVSRNYCLPQYRIQKFHFDDLVDHSDFDQLVLDHHLDQYIERMELKEKQLFQKIEESLRNILIENDDQNKKILNQKIELLLQEISTFVLREKQETREIVLQEKRETQQSLIHAKQEIIQSLIQEREDLRKTMHQEREEMKQYLFWEMEQRFMKEKQSLLKEKEEIKKTLSKELQQMFVKESQEIEKLKEQLSFLSCNSNLDQS